MHAWQVQDAKARFSEFLEASLREGPQIVTRRGIETAVLVPIQQWRSMERRAREGSPTLSKENGGGGCGPDEGNRVVIVDGEIVVDGLFEDAAPDAFSGDLGEEALDHRAGVFSRAED